MHTEVYNGAVDQPGTVPSQEPADEALLGRLLENSFIASNLWDGLAPKARQALMQCRESRLLLENLVQHRLLTKYQASCIDAGKMRELTIGNYRILDKLGSGGMGVVYRAEHCYLQRKVALKVLPLARDEDATNLQRFYAEMRALARLDHPNIVSAIDAGEAPGPDPQWPRLHYLVMELIQGQDLEQYVSANGPMPPSAACDLIHQIAWALVEAHRHELIHRDIKPSNILLTADRHAKLLDFGLARSLSFPVTRMGDILGTLLYMAPEQAQDSSSVDERADVYGLGATLFWCLTGKDAFPVQKNFAEAMKRQLTGALPSVRDHRPELPRELDAVVKRMMAVHPDDRYESAQAVMNALLPFIQPEPTKRFAGPVLDDERSPEPAVRVRGPSRVLVVDDQAKIRQLCCHMLGPEGLECEQAANADEALLLLHARPFDLVLSDWIMPGMSGAQMCRQIRADQPWPNLKIIMFSGSVSATELAEMLSCGVDDYLAKPFQGAELVARVKAAVRLKDLQDRASDLHRRLLTAHHSAATINLDEDSDLTSLLECWKKVPDVARRMILAAAQTATEMV